MPELPEVQTVVDTLQQLVVGKQITSIALYYERLLESTSQKELETLTGQTIQEISRRGKYLIFQCSADCFIAHLRMEGKFIYYPSNHRPAIHTHAVFGFSDGSELHFNDTRKFGRIGVYSSSALYFEAKGLGIEPFSPDFSGEELFQRFARYHKPIKTTLLDQHCIAGIGNIYADEVLFDCRIHPLTPANQLSRQQCHELAASIVAILSRAIERGGTTIRSFESSHHVNGLFQIELNAYGRAGLACHRCQHKLERMKISGRYATYCPHCQKRRD